MKRVELRWRLAAAGLGLASLCLCSPVCAAAVQLSERMAGQGEQKDEVPVPLAEVRKEAPDEAVNLKGLIRLDVMVRDAAGEPVAGLGRDDFTVLDNGQPQKIVAFRPSLRAAGQAGAETSPDVSLVVLLDTLALPSGLATEERQQVAAFLRANGGRLAWPVTVYTLEDTGFFLTAKASRDGNALAAEVEADRHQDPQFVPPTLQAKLHDMVVEPEFARDAPWTGVRALGTIAAAEDLVQGRKVLLWVGPGLRDAGTGTYSDEVYRRLRNAQLQAVGKDAPTDVTKADTRQTIFYEAYWFLTLLRQAGMTVNVFSVGEQTGGPVYVGSAQGEDGQKGWIQLVNVWKRYQEAPDAPEHASWMNVYKKVLAVESGGRVLEGDKEIAQQMAECARGANTYYTLTFDPPAAGHADEYHPLEVKLRRAGLTAETVRGYYDEPFYNDSPDEGARQVTAQELAALLHGTAGREQARLLAEVALTARLTEAERAKLQKEAHGSTAREALELVADRAEFEPASKSEVLPEPPPSAAEQQEMLARAQAYLEETIPRLPDFFAIRETQRFDSTAAYQEARTTIAGVPLHRIEVSETNVLYRHGLELANGHTRAEEEDGRSLYTYGTFGPMLKTAQGAIGYAKGVSWSRWERGLTGKDAVFAVAVPETGPHNFAVVGCCVLDHAGDQGFRYLPGYHGEVAIDPATGAILRFQVKADLSGFAPTEWSDVIVEYRPLTLGTHTFFVPQRSVSMWRGRALPTLAQWNVSFRTWGPEETRMNIFTFDHYRMFQGSLRILPGFVPEGNPPQ
jgi:VWFA-related protein